MTKPQKDPRKLASQARSKETVRAILEATMILLEEKGYEHFTTKTIAKKAGVSVGSLYQYFPNKVSIVAQIMENQIHAQLEVSKKVVSESGNMSLQELFREIIRKSIEFYKETPKLQRVIVETMPYVARMEQIRKVENNAVVLVQQILEQHQASHSIRNTEYSALIMTYTFINLLRTMLVIRPEAIQDDAFAEEFTDLILKYLE